MAYALPHQAMPSTENSAASTSYHENAPFLAAKEHPTVQPEHISETNRRSRNFSLGRKISLPFIIHGVVITIYTIILLFSTRSQKCVALPSC